MGVIVDHHCFEVVVGLVGIGRIVSHHCLYFLVRVTQKINEKRISFKCLKAQQTGIYKIYQMYASAVKSLNVSQYFRLSVNVNNILMNPVISTFICFYFLDLL
jgi:hypothetical protein